MLLVDKNCEHIKDDINNKRACLLLIDDQESQIRPRRLKKDMRHYSEVLPVLCETAKDHVDIIHVAMSLSYSFLHTQAEYDKENLHLRSSFSDNQETIFPVDFHHQFNAETDHYLLKGCDNALNDGVLEAYLVKNGITTVFVAGIHLKSCVSDTAVGLVNLKDKGLLRNVVIISDLTDHQCVENDLAAQHEAVSAVVPEGVDLISSEQTFLLLNHKIENVQPALRQAKFKTQMA